MIGRVEPQAKTRSFAKSNALPGPSSGRGILLAVTLVALALLAALWTWSARDRRPGESLEPETAARPEPDESPLEVPREPAERERKESDPRPPDDLALIPAPERAEDAARFEGTSGRLRGHVEVTGDAPFPQRWRLLIVPSTLLPGAEHAAERVLEFEDGRQDFDVPDLPLGGYDVSAEADGFNGRVQPVVLERGSPSPFLNLRLVPAGRLEGRVVDAGGLGLEGVPLTLVTATGETQASASSDAGGLFRFERVPDGSYELVVGHASSPILPERRALRFEAPWMNLPDIVLPPLGQFVLQVVDPLEQPIPGVEVRGSGNAGGLIEETTDAEGRIRARYLPKGHYRIRMEHPERGGRRFAIDLEEGEVEEARLVLGA